MKRIPLRNARDAEDAAPVARHHLARGGVIAYPTETSYGLGALLAPASLEMLGALKPRAPDHPYLILVDGLQMGEMLGLEFGPMARLAASRFWPGPLTVIVPDPEQRLPDAVRNSAGGIAVRETSHPGARALIKTLQTPLTSTSANLPGESPAQSARDVERAFAESVRAGDLVVLDGGTLAVTAPSTVLDCMSDPPTVLRVGAIDSSALDAALGGIRA